MVVVLPAVVPTMVMVGQTLPQLPQLLGSLEKRPGLTQTPLQQTPVTPAAVTHGVLGVQVAVQTPLTHAVPGGQQTPLQQTVGAPVAVTGHTRPHRPQLALSPRRSTQTSSQQ